MRRKRPKFITPSQTRLRFAAAISISVIIVSSLGLYMVSAQTGTSTESGAFANDTVDPLDVENLTAEPGDSEVLLKWDAASDNVGVVGYKIFRGTLSVKEENQSYNLPSIPVGNVSSYRVKNLTNGQQYFFSIVALDAAGNESASFAPEISATPKAGLRLASIEDDGKAPVVKEVRAEDIITVKVVFSEPVRLPQEEPASAFAIERKDSRVRLPVQRAELDPRDASGATIILTTAPQEKGVDYVLTAGIEVKDFYGTPISSGTADTGAFEGSDKKISGPGPGGADVTPPSVVSAVADFADRIAVTFSEKIKLPPDVKSAISIERRGTANSIEVKNVNLSVDGATLYITTVPQQPGEYEVSIAGIADVVGNELEEEGPPIIVQASGVGLRDLIPPEDITNLIAKVRSAQKSLVEVRWTGSADSAGDLAEQILYQSEGKEARQFGSGAPVASDVHDIEIDKLKPGTWYTFKITTKDTSGNESGGVMKSIFLPQVGPGLVAALFTAVMAGVWRKQRRKKEKRV